MGVPISNVPRRVVYAASGTGPYAFTFEILANTDIAVYKDDALLTLTTDYSVTIASNGTGSITLVSAPTGADQIAIVGNRTISRSTDFVTGGDFFANTINDELDQQTIFAQQNAEGLNRALQAPQTDPTDIDMTLPRASVRANKTLAFDGDGNPVTGEQIGDFRGEWASGTAYNKRDIVKDPDNSNIYYCAIAHTSTGSAPISSNTDSGKWTLIVDAVAASDAQDAAEAAQAAAETAQAAAETAETNAETSATAAASSASAASTSASNASTSASNASTSASTASTAATNAGNSATAAATSATNASNSATSASTSASTATTQASNASTSATNASTSATNAATSATNAAGSATTATTQATNASNSATAAATSETNAGNSATAAATSATNAATSETNAAASAAAAAASAGSVGFTASSTTTFTNKTLAAATNTVEATSGPNSSPFTFRNRLINGNGLIGQRGTVTLSGSAVSYGADRWLAAISGGSSVTATTSKSSLGGSSSGTGVFITGTFTTGNPYFAQRIEAANVVDMNSKTVTLSGLVYQDTGSSQNFVPRLTKANALDNWSASTTVATGTAFAVASGVVTPFEVQFTLGSSDATNGLMVEVYAASAITVTSKTFAISDMQLEIGSRKTPFEVRPIGTELALCQRYFEKSLADGTAATAITNPAPTLVGCAYSSATVRTQIFYKVPKRVTGTINRIPSATIGSGSQWGWYNGGWNAGSTSVSQSNANAFSVDISVSGFSAFQSTIIDGNWYTDAEL